MVAGFITAFFVVILATAVVYWRGLRDGKKSVAVSSADDDLLLREAEADAELALAEMSPEEQEKKRALLPLRKSREHSCLTEIQRRAIAALFDDGIECQQIRLLEPVELEPPTKKAGPSYTPWRATEGEWGGMRTLSSTTWPYLRSVLETRPRPKGKYVFQYENGSAPIAPGDILLCAGNLSHGEPPHDDAQV